MDFRARFSRNVRLSTALVAAALAFALGVASQHLRDAHAQSTPAVSSNVYVPNGGLVFRSLDGRPLARIGRDEGGGVVEVFDARGDVTTRVSARALAPSQSKAPNGFATDDPFDARTHEPIGARPGPGF